MERRFAETVLDNLSDQDYQWLHTIALRTTEQLLDQLLARNVLDPTGSLPKPGEIDDEKDCREATLRRVKAAQVLGALCAEVAGEVTTHEAANAVWLGASLADLGSASGSTRQAARKRWPDLGQIYRMRRFLSGHHEDIRTVAGELITCRDGFRPKDDVTPATLDAAYQALIRTNVQLMEDKESGTMVATGETGDQRVIRWQRWNELVDKDIRTLVEVVQPTDSDTDYVLSGAVGLLAHYDSISTPSTP